MADHPKQSDPKGVNPTGRGPAQPRTSRRRTSQRIQSSLAQPLRVQKHKRRPTRTSTTEVCYRCAALEARRGVDADQDFLLVKGLFHAIAKTLPPSLVDLIAHHLHDHDGIGLHLPGVYP